MKPKTLKPITPATKDILIAKKAISQIFYSTIYYPLLKALGIDDHDIKLNNANDPIIEKIQTGKIVYNGQEFAGNFDSRTSKAIKSMGGVFDKRKHTYKILEGKLPTGVRTAVAVQRINTIVKRERVLKTIEEINIKFADINHDFRAIATDATQTTDNKLNGQLADKLVVVPEITKYTADRLKTEYSESINLAIKNFTQKETEKLREIAEQNVFEGFRADKLEEAIKQRFGISQRRAKFIASQETQLLTAKYHAAKCVQAGMTKYIWKTMGDSHVRPDHARLNNLEFDYNNPPMTDLETKKHNNPGEDYNCRCYSLTLVDE